jgi:hypothetical protein
MSQARDLQKRAKDMLDDKGAWVNPQQAPWIWRDGTGRTWSGQLTDDHGQQQQYFNGIDMAMYGTSHLRELYLEMERLHFRISTRNVCNVTTPGGVSQNANTNKCHTSEEWALKSASPQLLPEDNGTCLPYPILYAVGSRSICNVPKCIDVWPPLFEGVDLEKCGPPGFRFANELLPTTRFAIGFKTFIHTPPLDSLFLRRLAHGQMSKVHVAIVEMGSPWGARGPRNTPSGLLPRTLTLQEEAQYYVKWVHEQAFPNTLVLWIPACGCHPSSGVNETLAYVEKEPLAVVLDKLVLCRTKPDRMEYGHGCAGPVLNVMARMVGTLMIHIKRYNNHNHNHNEEASGY